MLADRVSLQFRGEPIVMRIQKTYTVSRFKTTEDNPGTGSFVFATMNVIDKDGDLTLPGAFGNQTAKLVGAHDWSAPPIGIAKIHEEGDLAIANFAVNLKMASAVEWYESLKFSFDNGVTQEASYGFDVLKESFRDEAGRRIRVLESMKVYEVSPVMIGAGVNTHLRSLKGSRSMEEQFESVCLEVDDFISRAMALTALRAKENRQPALSQTMRERVTLLSGKLAEAMDRARALVAAGPNNADKQAILSLEARCLETQMRMQGRA